VTLGNPDSKGGFFPNGVNGRINSIAGYENAANAFGGYPGNQVGSCAAGDVSAAVLKQLHGGDPGNQAAIRTKCNTASRL
jgi:hypothetical protein